MMGVASNRQEEASSCILQKKTTIYYLPALLIQIGEICKFRERVQTLLLRKYR